MADIFLRRPPIAGSVFSIVWNNSWVPLETTRTNATAGLATPI